MPIPTVTLGWIEGSDDVSPSLGMMFGFLVLFFAAIKGLIGNGACITRTGRV